MVMFEPNPSNTQCVKKTFAEQIENGELILVEAAAWEEEGTVEFDLSPEDRGSESARGTVAEGGELVVKAETIDGVVQRLGLNRVDYIKMDIEGGERHALAGARQTVAEFGPKMALCIYHRDDDPEVVPAMVSEISSDYRIRFGTGSRGGQAYFFRD